jgi:hypothetical protein
LNFDTEAGGEKILTKTGVVEGMGRQGQPVAERGMMMLIFEV